MKRFKNFAIPWDKVVELFRESILVQSTITILIILTVCVLFLLRHPIPDLLTTMTLFVLGFFFGSKVSISNNRRE